MTARDEALQLIRDKPDVAAHVTAETIKLLNDSFRQTVELMRPVAAEMVRVLSAIAASEEFREKMKGGK